MSVIRFWRFNRERYTLAGVRCPDCGIAMISPHPVCPTCAHRPEEIQAPSLVTVVTAVQK
jgi:uncharacterized OB-fold protein